MSESYASTLPHATNGTMHSVGHPIVPSVVSPVTASSCNIPFLRSCSTRDRSSGSNPSGGRYPWHTTNASMEEFLDALGLAQVTSLKKSLSCEYINAMSFPRKILAT